MLPLPVLGLIALAVAVHHAERFTNQSWFWRSGLWYRANSDQTIHGDSRFLELFLKYDGTVQVTSMEGSWDSFEQYLASVHGEVWSVAVIRCDSFWCVFVPFFRRSEFTIGYERLSAGRNVYALTNEVRRITEYLNSEQSGRPGIAIRKFMESNRIAPGSHVRYTILWGYAALNATMLASLLLAPWWVQSWLGLPASLRFRRNFPRCRCVSCSYSLKALASSNSPSRCPECGTLNPPRPNSIPAQPSSPNSPPAPSSSRAPSEQSAPPPPGPPATTQSPPR